MKGAFPVLLEPGGFAYDSLNVLMLLMFQCKSTDVLLPKHCLHSGRPETPAASQ